MDKKEHERRYLNAFVELYALAKGRRFDNSENPDFISATDEGFLGIEVTQLHHNNPQGESPTQEQDSLRDRVVNTAQRLYTSCGGPPAVVTVHFANHRIRKADVQVLATAAKEAALLIAPSEFGTEEVRRARVSRVQLPKPIRIVRVMRSLEITETFWSSPTSTWIPKLMPRSVQLTINTKNASYDSYRQRCDCVWLLVYTEGFRRSSIFTVPADLQEHQFTSAFDKTFLLHERQTLFELRTSDSRRSGSYT